MTQHYFLAKVTMAAGPAKSLKLQLKRACPGSTLHQAGKRELVLSTLHVHLRATCTYFSWEELPEGEDMQMQRCLGVRRKIL